ncbi:MAG: hypothetical protein QG577_483 [Thermodesulfobacteriota bacterium]|nr:hypothetical protein [Thermodesulfobacteriota bacterium]
MPNPKRISVFLLLFIVMPCTLWALNNKAHRSDPQQLSEEVDGQFFKMKLSSGFKREPVDEAGIFKWKKDSAEIFIVVGDAFIESRDTLFNALRKAIESNSSAGEEVKILKIKGAKALLSKETRVPEQKRLRSWRLVVLTDKKIVTIDFTAPAKEFDSFVPAFEESLRSFKIVPQS